MAKRGPAPSLYADVSLGTGMELALEAARNRDMFGARLEGSIRADYAGTPATLMLAPVSIQEKVARMWEFYHVDPFFHRLIDRTCDFVANGSAWMVPVPADGKSWWTKISNWGSGPRAKADKEEEVWNYWHDVLNQDVPNMLPGLDQVARWATKHFLLGGMFIPHWQYGDVTFNSGRGPKMTYKLPIRMTCYPGSQITLDRSSAQFMEEKIYVTMPQTDRMQEGFVTWAPQFVNQMLSNQVPIPVLDMASPAAGVAHEGMAVKYNWSPGDLSTTRYGQRNVTGVAVYPAPPFYSLIPQFIVRQKLFAADAAILDGVLNYIMHWQIGDKDHPPKAPQMEGGRVVTPGTIAAFIASLNQMRRTGPAAEIFTPYWAKLNIIMPDSSLLLSEEKYFASTIEILQAFGIIMARSPGSRNERFERLNIATYEQFLEGLRRHINGFLTLLSRRIVAMNPGKLTLAPTWHPNPINTKSDQFLAALKELVQTGKVSAETLLRLHGLDSSVEIRRIAAELAQDVDDVFNANVPVSYSQTVADPEQPDPAGQGDTEGDPEAADPDAADEGDPVKDPAPKDKAPATEPSAGPVLKKKTSMSPGKSRVKRKDLQ